MHMKIETIFFVNDSQNAKYRFLCLLLRFSFVFFFVLLYSYLTAFSQPSSDNQFAKPLKDVLTDIQKKYGITIKYADSAVVNKIVTYADWKYRANVEVTLENMLKPLDMKVKKEKDKLYKLSNYEYFRWSVEDGWAELDRISAQYNTLDEWEKRKAILKPSLLEAMQLSHLPLSPNTAAIVTPERKFPGYSISNIAIEVMPGFWVNGSLYKPEKIKGKILCR